MRWLIYGWALAIWQRRGWFRAEDFAARDRTLDALRAVDTDLSSGAITDAEALARRTAIYTEARRRQMWPGRRR